MNRISVLETSIVACMAAVVLAGCQRQSADGTPQAGAAPVPISVSTVKPDRKTLKRIIEQPGQLEAFEETPCYARISGYVGKVECDIGMSLKSGDILAKLSVPELVAEHEQKKALIAQAHSDVLQAEANERAAAAHVETAAAGVGEATAGKERVEASYDRWNTMYQQMKKSVAEGVLDSQSRDEALSQMQAADAARKEQKAKVLSAEASHREAAAKRDKAKADVTAAKARVQVAQAEKDRVFAMLGYADIHSPYDCIVIRRNVHTGHFVQPGAGSGSQPLFVVARTNVLRVVIEIPETDAMFIKEGLEAVIQVQSVKDRDFKGKIARLSGSLDAKSRTLRAEIDLDNKDGTLRPGMYAYVTFKVMLPDRVTLPAAAVVMQGDKAVCWQIANGKAVRTPLRIGLREGGVVEVLKKQVPAAQDGSSPSWTEMSADDVVIGGNLANLTEGQAVTVK